MTTTYVFDFADGDRDSADRLGGKGANLAEMTRLGLPVPPGFTVSTEACTRYLATGEMPPELPGEIDVHLARVEAALGRRLGDPASPLLVSVRSGARFSMPGMMETILDIGVTDATVDGLAAWAGDERFAWDSYRRLVQMFGRTVCGVPGDAFESELAAAVAQAGATSEQRLDAGRLRRLVDRYRIVFKEHTGEDFPQDPREQLLRSVEAVFRSWNTERARVYRAQEHIPEDLGTAVNVMAMVFGNLGEGSGTGVAFTRDPATGARGAYGDYLADAQGEDVVAGIRNTVPLEALADLAPDCYRQLRDAMDQLEKHYRDLCDIEFTIERGRLWMLQTRVGKRTAEAAFVIAGQLLDEGVIDPDEALQRVSGRQLSQLLFPCLDTSSAPEPLARGVAASPGAASGRIVLDPREAAAATDDVVLVRRETTPDDLPAMIAARGILTSRGGKTSHAAVVARGMGKPCVCGTESLVIDEEAGTVTVSGTSTTLRVGDVISLDGSTGAVYPGRVPVADSPVVRYLDGELPADHDALVRAVDRTLRHADVTARLRVHANADTPDDAVRARRYGATGIGLCRTEHMFLGERRPLVERLILAVDDEERDRALAALLPLQRADFAGILTAMDGLPVTIRLIDPPLHEFLPPLEDLVARVAGAQARGEDPGRDADLLIAVRRMHEANPMLGLRGVRLGLVVRGLFAMQATAVAQAAAELVREGRDPRPQIMVPLVGAERELSVARREVEAAVARVEGAPRIPVGTMIEVPRAALTAGRIARHADFFSFGTNDLTQMTWAFSRDDVEGAFFARYLDLRVFETSPFESLDVAGVGRLVELAVREGREVRPDLEIGVCGEHGGDPASIHTFHALGLDYVSCSPYRVPVARLEAGRAARTGIALSDTR